MASTIQNKIRKKYTQQQKQQKQKQQKFKTKAAYK